MPQVHIDQTLDCGAARVRWHPPTAYVPALLARCFQIINLWQPIRRAAWDWPLALRDRHIVDVARGLVPMTLHFPDHEGETFSVWFSAGRRWKYLRRMEPE